MKGYEPPTVGHLRRLIAQCATASLMVRVAGSEAELNRLANVYGLGLPPAPERRSVPVDDRPAAAPAPVRHDRRSEEPLPARQAQLLGTLTHLAHRGDPFPGPRALGDALECSWLVAERDMRLLAKRRLIKIETLHTDDGQPWRRISICGTLLATAPPEGKDVAYRDDGARVSA